MKAFGLFNLRLHCSSIVGARTLLKSGLIAGLAFSSIRRKQDPSLDLLLVNELDLTFSLVELK